MTEERTLLDAQDRHWQSTFRANPEMYGTVASEPGRYAVDLFTREKAGQILELGAGQGRDTIALLRAGLVVTAIDYAPEALAEINESAISVGVSDRLTRLTHDVRKPLPLPDESVAGVYSHMLFNMAFSDEDLVSLANEVRRVLVPGGVHIYTVRHIGDSHADSGVRVGQNLTENGGFIVHFFDRLMVARLSAGFSTPEIVEFVEGDLPRRLWQITQRKTTEEERNIHHD